MKRRQWILMLALIGAMLLLSGCGVDYAGVDIMETPPQGWWQTLVVWPLGKALIWLDTLMQAANVPYHWGFTIIAFTIIIKVVTFPLTMIQIRGMQAQKELQPKIQELQKKYGKDREKLAQEQMKLYQEAGVNPLSGCLPLLVQMPILFGLYSALVALGPNLSNASWFWIPDLGFPRYTEGLSWIVEAFNQGRYGFLAAYLVLPALLMISQFVMQQWMTPSTPDAQGQSAAMMKQVGLMMTFMFGFFTLQVPAGLTLYWVTSNLLQMLQQWYVTSDRFKPAPATATAGAEGSTHISANSADGEAQLAPTAATASGAKADQGSTKARAPKRRRSKRR